MEPLQIYLSNEIARHTFAPLSLIVSSIDCMNCTDTFQHAT